MEKIGDVISKIDSFVWGPWMLVLLVGTGIFLSIRLRFLPWRNLGYSLKSVMSKEARTTVQGAGDVSPFSALMTALAATIGTGNIIGVATAMFSGGPGALVWMWISACFGLNTKFAECLLASKYREVNEKGEMSGGPMFTMKNAFKNKTFGKGLGILFSVFAVLASFGIGNMTQANSIASSLNESFYVSATVTGVVLMVLCLIIIFGGIKSISKVSSFIVPIMAVIYVISGVICIILNWRNLPSGVYQIFVMAFNPKAVSGGVIGTITATMMNAMRFGIARGCFSNEAGMGSAAISAAAATTDDPVRQGYINMTGTFFDTIVVCTVTGLVIASSGVLGTTGNGIALTMAAFESAIGPFGKYMVSVGIVLFAFSTLIGWEYQGEKAFEYLVPNQNIIKIYRIIYSIVAYVGATTALDIVWNFSDIMNALMAVPNLISLLLLSGVVVKETKRYQQTIQLEKEAGRAVYQTDIQEN